SFVNNIGRSPAPAVAIIGGVLVDRVFTADGAHIVADYLKGRFKVGVDQPGDDATLSLQLAGRNRAAALVGHEGGRVRQIFHAVFHRSGFAIYNYVDGMFTGSLGTGNPTR